MLRFLTAGESHGRALVVILEGLPAGLSIDAVAIDRQMRRRQGGHGRGRRMAIEADQVQILSGVRRGLTLGSPLAILVPNRDWPNWEHTMAVEAAPDPAAGGARRASVTRPRPGHADLAGALKYGFDDLRDVLERASARETAARVAAGTVARLLLERFGVAIAAHVTSVGGARLDGRAEPIPFDRVAAIPDDSPMRCVDGRVEQAMIAAVDLAREAGETLGGTFEVLARGVPPGLGSYAQWDRRLDGRLAQAIVSIPAVKAVSIGDGVEAAARHGSEVHDPIVPAVSPADRAWGLTRPSNHAGGLEGGVSNGEEIRLTAFMKPIATLMRPLPSVDLSDGSVAPAAIERSDTCAVPAAAVVGEAVVALVLADAFLDKFGGDSVADIAASLDAWRAGVAARFSRRGDRHPADERTDCL